MTRARLRPRHPDTEFGDGVPAQERMGELARDGIARAFADIDIHDRRRVGIIQIRVRATSRPVKAANRIATIKSTFKNTGAAAAAEKRPAAFSTPEARAASEMNRS